MADHLTEEEQIEAIKQWWKENWAFIVVPAVLAASLYYGWTTWQQNQDEKARQGSEIYQQLVDALETVPGASLSDEQRTQAESLAAEIAQQYAGSLYADNSNLVLGRLSVEKSDFMAAEAYIRRVVEGGANDSVVDLAKARLARVLVAQSKYDEALTLVSSSADTAYKSMYAEIRGDALAAQGNSTAAKTAYSEAIENLDAQQFSRQSILQLKVDGVDILAGTIPPAASEPEESAAAPAEESVEEPVSSEAPLANGEGNS